MPYYVKVTDADKKVIHLYCRSDRPLDRKVEAGRFSGTRVIFGRFDASDAEIWEGINNNPPVIDMQKFSDMARIFLARVEQFLEKYETLGLAAMEKINALSYDELDGVNVKEDKRGRFVLTIEDEQTATPGVKAEQKIEASVSKSGRAFAAHVLSSKRTIKSQVAVSLTKTDLIALADLPAEQFAERIAELKAVASGRGWHRG